MTNITLAMTTGRLLKIVRGDKFEVTMTGTPQEQETILVSNQSVVQKKVVQKKGSHNFNGDVVGRTVNFFGNVFNGQSNLMENSTLDVVISLPDECNLTLNVDGFYRKVDIDDVNIRSLYVSVNGSTRVSARKAEIFYGHVNGSGSIALKEISGDSVNLTVNGSGHITTTGGCGDISAAVSGSGHITMNDVHQGNMSANVAGSGSITITGQLYKLVSNIAGSGHVGLTAQEKPHTVSESVSGSGSVSIDIVP